MLGVKLCARHGAMCPRKIYPKLDISYWISPTGYGGPLNDRAFSNSQDISGSFEDVLAECNSSPDCRGFYCAHSNSQCYGESGGPSDPWTSHNARHNGYVGYPRLPAQCLAWPPPSPPPELPLPLPPPPPYSGPTSDLLLTASHASIRFRPASECSITFASHFEEGSASLQTTCPLVETSAHRRLSDLVEAQTVSMEQHIALMREHAALSDRVVRLEALVKALTDRAAGGEQ